MKILFSALTEPFWMHVVEVANNLSALGHEVHLASLLRSRPGLLSPAVSFHNVGLRTGRWPQLVNPSFLGAALRRLSGGRAAIRRAFHESRVIAIIDGEPFDLVYERDCNSACAISIAKARGIPAILEFNGISPVEMEWKRYQPEQVRRTINRQLRAATLASRIVSVSAGARDYYVERGIDRDKFHIIPNGANVELFRPLDRQSARGSLGWAAQDKILLYCGTLQIFYEVDCVIKAMPSILERVPDARLIAVGREYRPPFGLGRDELRSLAAKLGVASRVILLDAVPYEQVPLYLAGANLCILPVVQKEGWRAAVSPLKLREYMACGRPVLASNVPGDAQIVEKVGAGLLYQPGDAGDLADRACHILGDESLANRMGDSGHRHVLERGTWWHVAKEIVAIATQITSTTTPPMLEAPNVV